MSFGGLAGTGGVPDADDVPQLLGQTGTIGDSRLIWHDRHFIYADVFDSRYARRVCTSTSG